VAIRKTKPDDASPALTPDALWKKRLVRETRCTRQCRRTGGTDTSYRESPRVALFRDLLRLAGVYERGVRNARCPVLTRNSFSFADLPPAFDGLRVLHLSDFHFGYDGDIAGRVCRLVGDEEIDLCLMTGDFRFNHWARCRDVYDGVAQILSHFRPRLGFHAILGNNDWSEFARRFRALGLNVLVNAHCRLDAGGESIWLAGVDDPHEFRCDSLEHALRGVPTDAFTIVMAHSPEIIREADSRGVDLYLCGHTHGGQMCLPWLGPLYINARCPRRFALGGPWRYGNLQGLTNRGFGASTLPIRFNCPPEAVLIELKRA